MGRPHPSLIPLAAGRPIGPIRDPAAVLASAVEHNMVGLFRDAVEIEQLDVGPAVEAVLAGRTLRAAAHSAALWKEIAATAHALARIGIEFGVFKGVTTEARWYRRPGLRPASDVDIFVAPHHLWRFGEAVRALDRGHVLGDVMQRYVDAGIIQSTDVELPSGVWIDLHADPFKFGLPARRLEDVWERTLVLTAPSGIDVRVLDPNTALVQALLHLQKDRFSYLLGFADVARIIEQEAIDWDAVEELASGEGILIHVAESLVIVRNTLDLDIELLARRPMAFLWQRLWPESSRLQGDVGMSRMVRTRYWIPFSIRRRRWEALQWWLRLIFPPKRLFAYFHPHVTGPYLWRLVRLRSQLALSRHRRNVGQRQEGTAFRRGVLRRSVRTRITDRATRSRRA